MIIFYHFAQGIYREPQSSSEQNLKAIVLDLGLQRKEFILYCVFKTLLDVIY